MYPNLRNRSEIKGYLNSPNLRKKELFVDSDKFVALDRGGFTLLELILVIAILSILAVAGAGYYRNSVKSIEFDATAKNIVSSLRDARSRAANSQDNVHWGVNFVNSSTPNTYYYELFSTPTTYTSASTSIDSTFYLPGAVVFTSPASGATTTILFNKITGTTATSSITISFENTTATISVAAIGTVSK